MTIDQLELVLRGRVTDHKIPHSKQVEELQIGKHLAKAWDVLSMTLLSARTTRHTTMGPKMIPR